MSAAKLGWGEDEKLNQKEFDIEAHLPWGFESKLGSILFLIKAPLIVICAIIGVWAELHLKKMTIKSWSRQGNGKWFWGTVTGCYAHKLREHVPETNFLEVGVTDAINKTLLGGLDGDVWNSNVSVDPLNLMHKSNCQVDIHTCEVEGLDHVDGYFNGGVNHLIPFGFIWLIYKMIFNGVHAIDRAVLKLHGDAPDPPQPLLKLLTEPHFQKCRTFMAVVVKVFFYFRYKMLPNVLLGALASMEAVKPHCPRLVHYTMSPVYGNIVYLICVADLLCIGGMHYYFSKKMDGKIVGRWRYRLWKLLWFASAIPCTMIAVKAAIRTFGGVQGVIESCFVSLYMVLSLNFTFRLNVDVLKIMTFLVFFFEALELSFAVLSILGPKLCPVFFAKFKFLKSEDDYDELATDDVVPTVPPTTAASDRHLAT